MNVSLPESMKTFIDQRVERGGYGSHSEYVRALVRKDEADAARENLRALIAEGLSSPPGRSWNELRDELRVLAQTKTSAKSKRTRRKI